MDRTFAGAVAASVLLLAAGAVAGIYLGGAGVFDERQRVDPAVTGFSTGNVTCVAAPSPGPTVTAGNTTKGTFLVLRTNVTLRDGLRPTNATLGESGLANYTLSIEDGSGTGESTTCPVGESAVARVLVYFQVPHRGGEPFGVTVTHRDDRLFRVRNGPGGVRTVDVERDGE